MAKTLIISRPYLLLRLCPSTSSSFSLLQSRKRQVVSRSVVIFQNKASANSSLFSSSTSSNRTKLPVHSHGCNLHTSVFPQMGNRRFTAGDTNVNDPGSIDSTLMQSMEKKIKKQLNAESVTVKGAYEDGLHVSIDVISASFEGQSAVNRQRMVYKAIWEELQNTVHAVDQMTTKTPSEAAAPK